MKIWMIFIQSDGHTWLETAWDDESTAENHQGWKTEVERCRKMALDNNYEIRICSTDLSSRVYEMFEPVELNNTGISPVE